MSLPSLPNELLFLITSSLSANDLFSLSLTNWRFAHFLSSVLSKLMLQSVHATNALFHAAARRDKAYIQHLLEKGDGINVIVSKDYWFGAQRGKSQRCPSQNIRPSSSFPTESRGADPDLLNFVMELGPNLVLRVSGGDKSVFGRPLSMCRQGISWAREVMAIEWAASERSGSLLRLIMAQKEELENSSLNRALRAACSAGNLDAVKVLVEAGADIHEEEECLWGREEEEDGSLYYAARYMHVPVMRFLVKAGVDAGFLRFWLRPDGEHECFFCNNTLKGS